MGNLVRTISENGGIICIATDATKIVSRFEEVHKTSAVVTAAGGRLLTAASLMGVMLKSFKHSVTLRVNGEGPIGSMIAVSDGYGNPRAYVQNPVVEIPLNDKGKLDVGTAVGTNGFLSVVKDIDMKEPYVGNVKLVSGEIAEDITEYYAISEQIPTVCALGVLVKPNLTVKVAGGYLIQLLPGATEEEISYLENNIKNMPSVTNMLSDGMTPTDIAFKALDGFNPNVLDESEVAYRCNCSRERIEKALISMGKEELYNLADEQETTEVCCHFCGNKYKFGSDELKKLL